MKQKSMSHIRRHTHTRTRTHTHTLTHTHTHTHTQAHTHTHTHIHTHKHTYTHTQTQPKRKRFESVSMGLQRRTFELYFDRAFLQTYIYEYIDTYKYCFLVHTYITYIYIYILLLIRYIHYIYMEFGESDDCCNFIPDNSTLHNIHYMI